ncbi:MAG: peptidylprolyl isomerase [Chitinophagaceae bacterium]|nr:peptidylprolyl isomerase [Bacteroidota bacterium]MCC6256996.1 peptidylprolyl isomerase [Chitinophagaceae bacterium]
MQIIQTIREKGAVIVIIVIALSLIGFILMDARQGAGGLFGSMSTKIGKVDGENIDLNYFNKRFDEMEARNGQRATGSQTDQIREQVWNQIVAEKIFESEAGKLGINFTSAELSQALLSSDPSNPLMQEQGMVDPATGKLDITKAQTALNNIKKSKGDQRDMINAQIVDPLRLNSVVGKYSALISSSVYYPTWMQEKDNSEANNFSQISYVNIPYNVISDSTVKVTDDDVNAYVKKHPGLFKQDAGRMISYASFSQNPSPDDSAKIKQLVADLVVPFETDSVPANFVLKNGSTIEYNDQYQTKNQFNNPHIDTIIAMGKGKVFGPYVDPATKSYAIAKVVDVKMLPDSVRARHILIPSVDRQTGQEIRSDSAAKKLADSLLTAIQAGSDFTALAQQFSTDLGSKIKGGDLGYFANGAMVPEFNEFCFNNPVGAKKVVKTTFGYHVIDITGQKGTSPAYKIAFVGKEIIPSDVTINAASLEATKAAGTGNKAGLEKFLAQNGLHLTEVPSLIKENDFNIPGLQDARSLVSWAFKAKIGEVSDPLTVGDNFIVATVDKIYKEGLQDAATARPGAEAIIMKEKKTDLIIKKIGENPTLDAAAAAYGKSIQEAGADSTLTLASQVINGLGVEPKVIGASFNKSYQQKPSPAFGGANGVYVLKVNSILSKPALSPDVLKKQAISKLNMMRGQVGNWYEGLKNMAEIKDNRSKFF